MFSTTHTRDTQNPQDYFQHAAVAVFKSFKLIWYGIAGIIHGIFPEIKGLQFYTSSRVLEASNFLMMCGRHDDEIAIIFGDEFLDLVKKQRGY